MTHLKIMGIHVTKTNRLMLFRGEKIVVYSDNYTGQINAGCGKNKELNVKSVYTEWPKKMYTLFTH